MLIPRKVRIGGLVFTVKRVKPSELEVAKEGEIDYRAQTITLCDPGTEYIHVTFLHECLHGMFEALGMDSSKHDEQLIDGLAHQLHQFLTENVIQGKPGG